MSVQIEQRNKFYNTFTPFITQKTKSAEKTMRGRKERKEFRPPYKFHKELYSYFTAGGLLAFPVLAMAISQKNVYTALRKTDTEMFRLTMNEGGGFFHRLSERTAKMKKSFLTGFWNFVQPLKKFREKTASKLNAKNEESVLSNLFNSINNIFKNLKTAAGRRRYRHVANSFNTLEKSIEKRLHIFEESAAGKVKILFPKSLLKSGMEEIPRAVDISKTKSGKNRAQEARHIMAEIKRLLGAKNVPYEKILQKITFSCEDVYEKAEAKLVSVFASLRRNGQASSKTDAIVKEIYKNINGYRFAEKAENMQNVPAYSRRKIYLRRAVSKIKVLRKAIPATNKQAHSLINALEHILTERAKPQNMGLLEQLRILLKCDDIAPPVIKGGRHTSLFKMYSPEDYMWLKHDITNFARDLKFANKTQKHLLPSDIHEIDRGGIFTKSLAVGIPAGLLGVNIWNSKQGEEKAKSKRNFYSFIVGSAVMLASNYCTMNSQKRSIAYGILSAFITSRLAERYIKK